MDARGEVVGINTFLVSPSGTFSGMGFAIPTQIVGRRWKLDSRRQSQPRTHRDRHRGRDAGEREVLRPIDCTGGVVTQVEPDSPGAKAGLQIGDVITEIDGQKVSDAGELQVMVGQKQPGTKSQAEGAA